VKFAHASASLVLAATVATALGITGCTAPQAVPTTANPSPTSPSLSDSALNDSTLSDSVMSLSRRLNCDRRVEVYADLSLFDRARGLDCIRPDGRAVIVRAYAHASTVNRVVQEWGPTFGESRAWTRGDNWVVFGPRSQIEAIANSHGGSRPSTVVPAVETDPADAARDTCVSFVAGAASQDVDDEAAFQRDAMTIEETYPGASDAVRRIVNPRLRARLKSAPDYEVAAALSRFGDVIRSVCAHARPPHPDAP
jgi:hypothetical protein